MKVPKIGLLICNSGSSNSGALTGIAAMEVIREFSRDLAGICFLPTLANELPRRMLAVKDLEHLIVTHACSTSCAKSVAEKLSLSYDMVM